MPAGYALSQLFPELILAIGALALLMLGAIRGERSTKLVYELAIVLIGIALLSVFVTSPAGARLRRGLRG